MPKAWKPPPGLSPQRQENLNGRRREYPLAPPDCQCHLLSRSQPNPPRLTERRRQHQCRHYGWGPKCLYLPPSTAALSSLLVCREPPESTSFTCPISSTRRRTYSFWPPRQTLSLPPMAPKARTKPPVTAWHAPGLHLERALSPRNFSPQIHAHRPELSKT